MVVGSPGRLPSVRSSGAEQTRFIRCVAVDTHHHTADREETTPAFAFRFCLVEKEAFHIPQGRRKFQPEDGQVETTPPMAKRREHALCRCRNPRRGTWHPITA